MTIEEKKEFLKSYRSEYNKWKALEEQKKEIIADSLSAKAQSYDDMPKSHVKTDLSDIAVRLEKIMKDIDEQIAEFIAIKVRIQSAILDVSDGTERRVLVERYLHFNRWEKISHIMDYSEREIHRLHGRALQHIEL